MEFLLYPMVAFAIYLGMMGLLSGFGRMLAGPGKASIAKSSTYASGEADHTSTAAPGYRQFFIVALFFAVLHLGVLMVGSGNLTWITGVYLAGLMLVLIALILG